MRAFSHTIAGQVITSFLIMSGISVALFLVGAIRNQSWVYWYLLWNLFLAWVPLLISLSIIHLLKTRRWASWPLLGLTLAWLVFLPNTFYMITDFIHLNDVVRTDHIFDALMFSMIVLTSVAIGLVSLGIVHLELNKRLSKRSVWRIIAAIILLVSFAVYLGRELRWNTWDILYNPMGMLFDISDLILRPWAYPGMFVITLSFFTAIMTLYCCAWWGAGTVRSVTPTR